MPILKTLITREQLQKRVAELGQEIAQDGRIDLVVGVLTGSFIFVADLVRSMSTKELLVQFVKASSYGQGTTSSALTVQGLERLNVYEKNVLIVDDIFDTGHTLKTLSHELFKLAPTSVKTCALLNKPSRREVDFKVDYVGFTVENRFLVGYGLDYAEEYRCLPDISYLE